MNNPYWNKYSYLCLCEVQPNSGERRPVKKENGSMSKYLTTRPLSCYTYQSFTHSPRSAPLANPGSAPPTLLTLVRALYVCLVLKHGKKIITNPKYIENIPRFTHIFKAKNAREYATTVYRTRTVMLRINARTPIVRNHLHKTPTSASYRNSQKAPVTRIKMRR